MIRPLLLIFFIMSACLQASSEATCEQTAAAKTIKPDEGARIVTDNKAKPPVKKEKKDQAVSEAPKQTPVTSSIFATKTLSSMNFDELKKSKEAIVKSGDKKTAIKYLERMNRVCKDCNELKVIMLELAQLLFEIGDYTKSSKMYHEFTLLYPGSDEVEFAMYQAIISSFKQILDPEHDQSNTAETRELAQSFLERSSFTTYKKDVEEIATKCDDRLLESEINIFNFYMKRGNYVAANTRLSTIKLAYSGKNIPNVQTRVAQLETRFALEAIMPKEAATTTVAVSDQGEKTEAPEKKSFVDHF